MSMTAARLIPALLILAVQPRLAEVDGSVSGASNKRYCLTLVFIGSMSWGRRI
jgi:hypothetical protein